MWFVVEGLTARQARFESVWRRFDPTTPDGRLFYTMTLAMAEREVGNLALCAIDGLKAAVRAASFWASQKKDHWRRDHRYFHIG